jgi:hypothetical protein
VAEKEGFYDLFENVMTDDAIGASRYLLVLDFS